MSSNSSNQSSFLLLKTLLVFVLFVIAIMLVYRHLGYNAFNKNNELQKIEQTSIAILSGMNVDSIKLTAIKKITQIISKYNPNMPSGIKYEIAEAIYSSSVNYTNLDIDLICAVITHESGGTWEPEVISQSGAMGLMQIMPATGIWVAHYESITWTSAEDILFNPFYNIRIGCRQLSAFIDKYELEGGLAAYNGGEKKAALWVASKRTKGILWAETNNYIPHVLLLYNEYKLIAPGALGSLN